MEAVPAIEARPVLGVHVLLDQLRCFARVDVPRQQRRQALRHIDELESALLSPAPDVARIGGLARWFAEQTPAVKGPVTRMLRSSVVAQVLAAGGAAITEDLARFIA